MLTLIVTAAVTRATMTTDSVNLVDKHDARCVFLGLFEHVTDTGCAHAYKHFHKVRTGNGEERHTRLTCDRPRKKRLTCARRTNKQRALRNLSAQTREFLRVAQEFHDFFQLFLGFINAGDIVKGHAAMLFGQHLGFGFAKTHGPATTTALHPVHEVDPDTNQQQEGQQGDQE